MRRRLALAFPLFAAACGSSSPTAPPATPTPVPVVSFAGTYSGTYTITACGQTGTFATAHFCDTLRVGTIFPMSLTLSQSGNSVEGTLLQGRAATPVTGFVNGSGQLILDGSTASGNLVELLPEDPEDTTVSGNFAEEIVGWNTSLSGNALVGSWNAVWTWALRPGTAQTVQTLTSVVKTPSVAKSTLSTHPNRTLRTVQAIFEAMRR
jgi:hypothetical protein